MKKSLLWMLGLVLLCLAVPVFAAGSSLDGEDGYEQEITMNRDSLVLARGKTGSLQVSRGKKAVSGVSWRSSNTKVAEVDQDGRITAKKVGNAIITASVNGQKAGCVVSVTTKKKASAIKLAIKIVKTCKYNQGKRMKDGFYDCSSLVWKAYHNNGCNFGIKEYAPTAADQARYMDTHNKSLGKCTKKRIASLYYRAGDVCYHIGPKNKRYKNIYHTELLVGYSFSGFDSKGKAIVSPKGIRSYIRAGDPMARP